MRCSTILLLLALALPSAEPAPSIPLNLDACLAEAEASSISLRQARRQVEIADWQVREAWAPSLPHLSADWRHRWRSNDPSANMNGGLVVTGERQVDNVGFSAQMTLIDFGRAGFYRDALRVLRDGTALEADRARQSLDLQVARSFFGHLAAVRLEGLARKQVVLLDRQYAVADDLFRQGQVAAQDRTAVDVQRKERQQSLLKAMEVRDTTRAALNRLRGRDLDAPLVLVDELERPTWRGSATAAEALALSCRPDLASARTRIRAGGAALKSARSSLLPRVYAFGAWDRTNDEFSGQTGWWTGGVGVSFSIFDGGATIAQAGRALEELKQIEDAAADRLDQVRLEVRQAWLTLGSVQERVGVAAAALVLAEENLSALQERYAQGLATSTDVLAEEARLAQARYNHATALYDLQTGYAELVHAIGADPLRLPQEQQP